MHILSPCKPFNSRLLVGGGDGGGRRDGAFWILDATSLAVDFEGRDCRGWIRAAAWGPDASAFAIASHDHQVCVCASTVLPCEH